MAQRPAWHLACTSYLPATFHGFVDFLQKVSLPAALGVPDGRGVCRFCDEQVGAAFVNPGSSITEVGVAGGGQSTWLGATQWTPATASLDPRASSTLGETGGRDSAGHRGRVAETNARTAQAPSTSTSLTVLLRVPTGRNKHIRLLTPNAGPGSYYNHPGKECGSETGVPSPQPSSSHCPLRASTDRVDHRL